MNSSFFYFLAKRVQKYKRPMHLIAIALLFPVLTVAAPPTISALTDDFNLQLSDGSAVALAGIVPLKPSAKLPAGWQNASVTLEPLHQDRYGAQHYWVSRPNGGPSLNAALINAGAALAYTHDEATLQRIKALAPPAKFMSARETHSHDGIWAYVRGTIQSVTILKNAAYLNFGDDWKEDFTIYLPKQTLKAFDETQLSALEGKQVSVRGWLHRYYGPRITLFHPHWLETEQ